MSARACIKHGRCRRANTLLGLTMVHTFGAPGCAKGLCRHRVRQRSLQAAAACYDVLAGPFSGLRGSAPTFPSTCGCQLGENTIGCQLLAVWRHATRCSAEFWLQNPSAARYDLLTVRFWLARQCAHACFDVRLSTSKHTVVFPTVGRLDTQRVCAGYHTEISYRPCNIFV
jgi:hypothetical protein